MKLNRFPIFNPSLLLFLAYVVLPASAQSHYVGWIEEIHGQTYWRPSLRSKRVHLDVHADQYRRLYAGEALRCAHGATLQLRIYGSLQAVTEKSGWYQIPEGGEVPSIAPFGTPGGKRASIGADDAFAAQAASIGADDAFAAQAMINADRQQHIAMGALIGGFAGRGHTAAAGVGASGGQAVAAGASVGAGPRRVIYSPANGGYVLADDIVFRWAPEPQPHVLTLAIEDNNGSVLWREEGVDGAVGQMISASARKVLRDYRDEKKSGPFRFVLVSETGSKRSVDFSVLSVDDERVVRNELERWDGQEPVLRHLGRALVFRKRGMTFDVVQEYEAALASAPQSDALSRAMTEVYRNTGIWQASAASATRAPEKPPK